MSWGSVSWGVVIPMVMVGVNGTRGGSLVNKIVP
jgi:hypothetical protein